MSTDDRMIDLNASLSRAVTAARRGDVDGLEFELTRLRRSRAAAVGMIGTQLRGIARAARAHPSFRSAPAAQAG
jgi:hypothetical protein